jgi:hypothetical protein
MTARSWAEGRGQPIQIGALGKLVSGLRERRPMSPLSPPNNRASGCHPERSEGSAVAFGAVRIRENRETCLADARLPPWRFGVNPETFSPTWGIFRHSPRRRHIPTFGLEHSTGQRTLFGAERSLWDIDVRCAQSGRSVCGSSSTVHL